MDIDDRLLELEDKIAVAKAQLLSLDEYPFSSKDQKAELQTLISRFEAEFRDVQKQKQPTITAASSRAGMAASSSSSHTADVPNATNVNAPQSSGLATHKRPRALDDELPESTAASKRIRNSNPQERCVSLDGPSNSEPSFDGFLLGGDFDQLVEEQREIERQLSLRQAREAEDERIAKALAQQLQEQDQQQRVAAPANQPRPPHRNVPDTSKDEEFARKLQEELNRELADQNADVQVISQHAPSASGSKPSDSLSSTSSSTSFGSANSSSNPIKSEPGTLTNPSYYNAFVGTSYGQYAAPSSASLNNVHQSQSGKNAALSNPSSFYNPYQHPGSSSSASYQALRPPPPQVYNLDDDFPSYSTPTKSNSEAPGFKTEYSPTGKPTKPNFQPPPPRPTSRPADPYYGASSSNSSYPTLPPPSRDSYEAPLSAEEMKSQLRNLLQNVEHTENVKRPEERLATPPEMRVQLLPHQQIGVEWMVKMEQGTNRGGIMADDMGLGKTVQSIATMILNRPQNPQEKGTLVVAPLALVGQWEAEIKEKLKPGVLKVYIYHGSDRVKNVSYLQKFDVVITTYHIMAGEWPAEKKGKKAKGAEENEDVDDDPIAERDKGPLYRIKWHRIILDEAHLIKNRSSKVSKASIHLDAKYRWCLTGTPIQNNLEELYPLLRFLEIKPYCDWTKFRSQIVMKKAGVGKVQALLKACCLRRAKNFILDGKPIVTLPERNININYSNFSAAETEFYKAIETKAQVQFNRYLKEGSVMKNYNHVLAWLLRLRQACCHPSLVTTTDISVEDIMGGLNGQAGKAAGPEASESAPAKSPLDRALDKLAEDVVKRMIEGAVEEEDCSICYEDMTEAIFIPECGHAFCRECLTEYAQMKRDAVECPKCRGPVNMQQLLPLKEFVKRFKPSDELEESVSPASNSDAEDDLSSSSSSSTKSLKSKVPKKKASAKGKEKADPEADIKMFDPDWVSSTKVNKVVELLEDTRRNHPGEKTIVFAQFTAFLDLLETPLIARGFEYVRYDGSMDRQERQESIDKIKEDPNVTVILISLMCGSLGLNMTCCNRVILTDLWWNPAVENQAIDRAHRFGQSKKVIVERILIRGTVEDRILQLQQQKQDIFDSAFGEGKGRKKAARLTMQDLMHLFACDD
ncbi:hypothetical protein HK102_014080 [Quaeritorhiza haematococci]|nr:hypothetical protein HK102_014080 [Quaeritorhiza haematococci]